jgi:uncharacterized protein
MANFMKLFRLATICTLALSTLACHPSRLTTADSVAMSNPASVACVTAGGKSSFRYTDQGQYGICTFPSGRVCEEWAVFRGECF